MAQIVNYHNDIVLEHRERMLNLKKYYPFFKVIDTSFSNFREGEFEYLDMGYIVMAVLRFFIEENNFNEKDVTYPEYTAFLTQCLKRDFNVVEEEQVYKEIADFVFDRLKNDGRPFEFSYYDPVDKKKRSSRLRIIESKIRDHIVWYSISAEAVEFYLDTKEIRDESRISVSQLLLEKMIKAQDFKGGAVVIDRINSEVSRLLSRKNEILALLTADVHAGIQAYEEFVATGMRWFEDEQKLFVKNTELIESALARVENSQQTAGEGYYRTIREIFDLETQLKVAMNRHGQLLLACTDMAKNVDDIIRKTKLSRLRSSFDFKAALKTMIDTDDALLLDGFLLPMLKPKVVKQFALYSLDEAMTIKPERFEERELVERAPQEEIMYEDEVEELRIGENFAFLMKTLIGDLQEKKHMDLREWLDILKDRFGQAILDNADLYSFLLHLCQKKQYSIGEDKADESFLDDIIRKNLKYDGHYNFEIEVVEPEDIIELNVATVTNIIFKEA